MAHTDTKDTPTPQVDEGVAKKTKATSKKSAGKNPKPLTLKDAVEAEKLLERKATRKSRATHAYKIPVEPEVAATLSALAQASGFSIRQLYRIAISHLIKVYSPHYGLPEWHAPEVKMPPPMLATKAVQQEAATPMPAPFFPANGFPRPGSTDPYKTPEGYPPPPHIRWGTVHLEDEATQQPLTPYSSGELNGIPYEEVPFKF